MTLYDFEVVEYTEEEEEQWYPDEFYYIPMAE